MEIKEAIGFGLILGITSALTFVYGYIKALHSVSKQISQLRSITADTRKFLQQTKQEAEMPLYNSLDKEFYESD